LNWKAIAERFYDKLLGRRMSRKLNLDAMSVDEIWRLHERIIEVLAERLSSEKRQLETRLAKLRRDQPQGQASEPRPEQRKIPTVSPKYRNPDRPSETWSGRGKRPRWLTAALTAGRTIEEFIISDVASGLSAAGRRRV
jgi:DNA-binding protein H-NS